MAAGMYALCNSCVLVAPNVANHLLVPMEQSASPHPIGFVSYRSLVSQAVSFLVTA
jgi:hypothetical protein